MAELREYRGHIRNRRQLCEELGIGGGLSAKECEKQIIVNELSTCLLKYPDQMKGKLEDVKTAVDDMQQELDKGYEKAKEIVDSVDKKGN